MNDRKYWDIRARSFPGYCGENEFQAAVFEAIARHGVDFAGAHVLDLGCGAGTYAIPIARRARMVTALDLSPAMLGRLADSAAALGIANIRYVESGWAEYSVQEKFDIIFCSRCPAIQDHADLRKACGALTGWGIFFHFSGHARASDTYSLGAALLELHGMPRKEKKYYGFIQDWLREDGIPFAVYPLRGESRAYRTLDEMAAGARDIIEAAGVAPDPRVIREYLEQFRDDASGMYLSVTRHDMELVIWQAQG